MSSDILTQVTEMIEPILNERELTLVDLEYVREGKNNFLRIYLDKAGGIDLNECGIASELISEKLDDTDIIKGQYYLDISSPGAERPLKTKEDFSNQVGNNVYVSLYVHIDGEKEYVGVLEQFTEDEVAIIETKFKHTTKKVEVPYDKIAKARLAVVL